MNRQQQLQTVSAVIDAFGGPKAMSEIFGGVPSKFCNYRASGKFPDCMHHKLYKAARKRGLNIAEHLLGGEDDGEPLGQLVLQAAE